MGSAYFSHSIRAPRGINVSTRAARSTIDRGDSTAQAGPLSTHWQCVAYGTLLGNIIAVQTDDDLLAIGRQIARLRSARRMSQEQLAELAGLHRNYVGLVERGQRNPRLKTLIAIAEALNATLAELFEGVPRSSEANIPRGGA